MPDYTPSSLPEIDEVQILVLSDVRPDGTGRYMTESTKAPTAVARDMEALRIAGMWRALPSGEAKRCHTPPFGVRFLAAGQVVCKASLCWQCNTIFGDAQGSPFTFEFDGRVSPSQQLLSELQRIVSHQIGGGVGTP